MKKQIALLLILCLSFACTKAQLRGVKIPPENKFRPDTIYYPLYNGVQMIVINHAAAWVREMAYKSQYAQDYRHIPPQQPNVYLFRHQSGVMVAAYNTSGSLVQWASVFKYKRFAHLFISDGSPLLTANSHEWECMAPLDYLSGQYYPNYEITFCKGYYLIYGDLIQRKGFLEGNKAEKKGGLDFGDYSDRLVGLIDSLGIIRVQPVYKQIRSAGNHLLVQKKFGEWGIIDKHSKNIVPFEYDDFKAGESGLREYCYFIKNKKICALYHIPTAKLTPVDQYDDVYGSSDSRNNNVVVVRRDGKIGFMSKQFVETVSPCYEVLESFFQYDESLYRVIRDGKAGFINTWGQEVIPCVYEHVERFKAGKALVLYQGKWQYIDTSGQVLPLAPGKPDWQYEDARGSDFKIAKHHFFVEMCGLVDARTDSLVVPLRYQRIELRPKERFFRVLQNGKLGILDIKGRLALPCEYDEIGEFYDKTGVAFVRKNGQQGIINRHFSLIVPCTFESLRHDLSGHIINRINAKEGLMDTLGNTLIPNHYDWLGGFAYLEAKWSHRFARIRLNGKQGYINLEGREVVPAVYEDVGEASNHIIAVKKDGKWGMVDTTGKILTLFEYDEIDRNVMHWTSEKVYVKVKRGEKMGLVNKWGKELVPCQYDNILGFISDGKLNVKNGNQTKTIQVEE